MVMIPRCRGDVSIPVHLVISLTFTGNWYKYFIKEINAAGGIFSESSIKTNWFEQPLDHFDKNETRTWRMKYFERHDYWREDGPIYVFINGEGPASSVFLTTGMLYDLAKETGGAMYVSEHRYYGDSKPFVNLTSENLAYLSSRQALADVANLLKYILSMSKFKNSKVVVVGGSYAGNLAAWMKVLYPNLIDAAIASSAPVLAKADFYEYLETVSKDFEEHGTDGCWDNIAARFKRYERLFQTSEGIKQLKEEENICKSTDFSKDENRQLFFLDNVVRYMIQAQYGRPESIRSLCRDQKLLFENYIDEPNILWDEKNKCNSYDFDEMIEEIRASDMWVSWLYQTCTEFGYYQTTNSGNHPFTRNIPIEFFYRQCSKLFGSEFDGDRVEKGVKESNEMYGGLNPNVSHVVFVNGDMDPWSRLGILEDVSYEAPALVIPRSSHCRDLFSDKKDDSEELKEARRYIRYLIKDWIGAENYKAS
ncbi:putative serine protease K12H4.7 [Amyelois transitella]|uniref:putative serine protease K12H4.7 n=1 Tax=Amyelois transitella TaxID=680683 RepID=UPI00298FCE8F|nr:putative serine protease K12H4.7 [Amyelois transitella]